MEYNEFLARDSRLPRKHYPEKERGLGRNRGRDVNDYCLSQPKGRGNIIKINKSKLPVDFFRNEISSKRVINFKIPLKDEYPELVHKAQTERLHYSPEKTSFFANFDEPHFAGSTNKVSPSKLYNRKFQTRNEPKRDNFPLQPERKFTPATKSIRNDLLDLFPSTHDEHLSEIIISSSKTKNLKISPRKELIAKYRDPQPFDPQKQIEELKKEAWNIKNDEKQLNITFFNAKSTCFPPINRPI